MYGSEYHGSHYNSHAAPRITRTETHFFDASHIIRLVPNGEPTAYQAVLSTEPEIAIVSLLGFPKRNAGLV